MNDIELLPDDATNYYEEFGDESQDIEILPEGAAQYYEEIPQEQEDQSSQYWDTLKYAGGKAGELLSIPARGLEQVVGAIPASVESALNYGILPLGKRLSDAADRIKDFFVDPSKEELEGRKLFEKEYPKLRVEMPLTPEWIRNAEQVAVGQFFESDDPIVKFMGDIVGTTAMLSVGGPKNAKDILKKGVLALGAESGKEVGQTLGDKISGNKHSALGNALGEGLKQGTLLVGAIAPHLRLGKRLKAAENANYSVFDSVSPHFDVDTLQMRKNIRAKLTELGKQDIAGGYIVKDFLKKLYEDLNEFGSKIPLDRLRRFEVDANSELGNIINKFGKDGPEYSKFNNGIQIIRDGILEWGKDYPQIIAPYKIGKELTQAINTESVISNFFKSAPKETRYLFRSLPFVGKVFSYSLSLGTVWAADKIHKNIKMLIKSPQAMAIFTDMMNGMAKQSTNTVLNSARKLDKVISKNIVKDRSDLKFDTDEFLDRLERI